MEHESDGYIDCSWCPSNGPQIPGKETGGNGDQRKTWDHPDHNCQNHLECLKESWRPEETCCHMDFSERAQIKSGVKNSQRVK